MTTPPDNAIPEKFASGDWSEDFAAENGRYLTRCGICGRMFEGHKRRVTCKLCSRSASGAEKWTVEASADFSIGSPIYDINTGKELLRMVTKDYQCAVNICDAHNASLSLAEARAEQAEFAIGGCIKTLMKHGETNAACTLTELAKPILARLMAAEARAQEAERRLNDLRIYGHRLRDILELKAGNSLTGTCRMLRTRLAETERKLREQP